MKIVPKNVQVKKKLFVLTYCVFLPPARTLSARFLSSQWMLASCGSRHFLFQRKCPKRFLTEDRGFFKIWALWVVQAV